MFLHGVHLVENTNDDCFETNIASSGSLLGLKQADKPCMRAISLERQLADIPSLDQVVRKPVAEASSIIPATLQKWASLLRHSFDIL